MKKRHLVSLVTIIKDNLYAYRKANWESKDVVETVSELITKKFAKYMKDQEGLETYCEQARNLGFTGKGSINPKQVPIINKIFSPNSEESTQK